MRYINWKYPTTNPTTIEIIIHSWERWDSLSASVKSPYLIAERVREAYTTATMPMIENRMVTMMDAVR